MAQQTVLFAGGGSGGHIAPALAVWDRVGATAGTLQPLFVVSDRAVDAQMMGKLNLPFEPIPVQPLTTRPWRWPRFYRAWRRSVRAVGRLLADHRVAAVVATGGFVAGPAVKAARAAGLPVALLNVDAVPGKANRWLRPRVTAVFSAYPWRGTQRIGLPVRHAAIGPGDSRRARRELGLDPDRETLLVTAGSQGAASLNQMMVALVGRHDIRQALRDWQILHVAGDKGRDAVASAYLGAGVTALTLDFCDRMGLAWGAASFAISRAGANSVAEAWANAVPAVFYPYPWHRDQHQRLNAQPLVTSGGGILLEDRVEPQANAAAFGPHLLELVGSAQRRHQMAEALRATRPPDGAAVVAQWVLDQVGSRTVERPQA